ncbi:MAG: hypothetical protein JXB10_10000 [Pirellulales bacterium]|nr:hypothetical protein [Pirellulales bacterium]
MKSLLHGAWTLLLYACLATLVSQVILVGYLASAWNLDGARWSQALDVARGAATVGRPGGKAAAPEPAPEQPSVEQILETRALKDRNLDLREHQLQNELAELEHGRDGLEEEQKKFRRLREDFNAQLLALREKSTAAGEDEVRRTLESIDSAQAKKLILNMLENKEMDAVVTLLLPMSDSKRARIIGEFTTPEELEKISEVLRRIREGRPEAPVSEAAQQQLGSTK